MATTTTSANTPSGLELKLEDALEGVQQELPAKSSLQINNAAMTQAQMVTQLTGYLTTVQAVGAAKATYAAAVVARTAMQPAAREFLVQLRAALLALYGRGSPQLAKFGMTANKPSKPSPTTSVLAAAARQLTRAQRGTISKKQRQSITVVSPPQVTMGGTGKPVILPPTVNGLGSGAVPGAAVAASSAPQTGQASAGQVPTGSAVAQPAVAPASK